MDKTYAIRGGRSGRERLRVLSHVLQGGTLNFLDRVGLRPGMACLDVGCGGGDVTRELARRVGSAGRVVGLDMDLTQLEIVRAEAAAQNIMNIDYRVADVGDPPSDLGAFDFVYTRFLLCHLKQPGAALTWMVRCLKPGGILAIEDCAFTGHFCYPPSPAFDRYVELCGEVMRRRGGDPGIGLKLPQMITDSTPFRWQAVIRWAYLANRNAAARWRRTRLAAAIANASIGSVMTRDRRLQVGGGSG